jgi:2-alkyl-3-oxoalkanoate reductase
MKGLIIVDGAGGYVGGHVVQRLAGAGYRVRAVDMPDINLGNAAGEGVETASFDLTRPETLPPVLSGATAVVHCAAAFDLSLSYEALARVNVIGTRNLIKACQDSKIHRFIHISTGGVYGSSRTWPVDETCPTMPMDAYAKSKLDAEKEVFKTGSSLNATIFRPTVVYGPGGKYIAGAFYSFACILSERKIPLPRINRGPVLNWVHVSDIAGAIEFALRDDRTIGNVYNLAEKEMLEAGDFFEILKENFGIRTMGRITIPPVVASAAGKLGWHLPAAISARPVSKIMSSEWKKIVARHNLVPDLQPVFPRDFYCYFIGHHAYSSKALCDLGFVHEHPNFSASLPGVLQWYRERKWIP